MDNELIRELLERGRRAALARPGVAAEDILFKAVGPEETLTIQEVNAAGEPLVFLVVRVAMAPPSAVVAGSMAVSCDRCGEAAWMSPAARQTYERIERRRILCLECAGLPIGGELSR